MGNVADLTGWKMWEHGVPTSKLTVIGRVKGSTRPILWECECSCDAHNHVVASTTDIRKANIISCGCVTKPGLMTKCVACGKKIERNAAFQVTDEKGMNRCYCSEKEYLAFESKKQKEKEDDLKVYNFFNALFGYKILNTVFFNEHKLWRELKSDEIIAQFLEENKYRFIEANKKSFKSEGQKIKYMSAIVKNSLADYKPKVVEEIPKVIGEETTVIKRKTTTRQALIDFEEDCDE